MNSSGQRRTNHHDKPHPITTPPDPDMSIASPCINLCRMSAATGRCEGCFRSLDEIARWSRSEDSEKLSILELVARRRAAVAAAAQALPSTEGA